MEEKQATRRSTWAVWRWRLPWWAWGIIAEHLIVAYLLTGVPVLYFLSQSHTTNKYVWQAFNLYTAPHRWCAENSKLAADTFVLEHETLERWFGATEPVELK